MPTKLSLRRLPAPLTFYVQIEVLSESHLRQVTKLRDVYGPDLLRDLSPWKWNCPPTGDNVVWAAILLNTIRPEERAFACVHPAMVKDCVVRGCETFASYVLQHRKIVLQWVIAVFWWENKAAQGGYRRLTLRSSSTVRKIVFRMHYRGGGRKARTCPTRFRTSEMTRFSGGAFIATCGTQACSTNGPIK